MTERWETEKKRLRSYLNPAIKGKNTDIILESLSKGAAHLITNIEAVDDNIYVVSSSGRYLDTRLADRDLTRPENVGLSDDVFKKIGIEVSSRKQIRDLILAILEITYGVEYTRATSSSNTLETYFLEDGDTLQMQFDDEEIAEVVFTTAQFANINAATAEEVADAITKSLRQIGRRGSAYAQDDGLGSFVTLISQTNGPSSSIRVLGGKAQNKLRFAQIRPTTADFSTQWTLSQQSGGVIRATWTGGANPSIGKTRKGDYVNIYGTAFNILNRGTFPVTKVQGGLINNAYVEFTNQNGISETTIQGNAEAILFFNAYKKTLNSKRLFATAYQTESRLLEVFIPAMTKIVRRERIGSAHLHDSGSSNGDFGPYIYDLTKPYLIGPEECATTQVVDASSNIIIQVNNASSMPDVSGNLVFAFGTQKEEGPIPYIARPSSNTIMINPSYKFKNVHQIGTNISLIASNSVYDVASDGTDYPLYITDVVSGRIYAEDLIKMVAATGIRLVITILYPNPIGLSKWQTTDDTVAALNWQKVFGPDEV